MVCYGVMAGAWAGYFVYRSERGKLIECLHATPEKCVSIKNAATQNEPNRSLVCATFSQRKLLNKKKSFLIGILFTQTKKIPSSIPKSIEWKVFAKVLLCPYDSLDYDESNALNQL